MLFKKDIARAINQQFDHLDKNSSKDVVDAVFDYIKDAVYRSEKVQIVGFATFYVDVAKPRTHFNVKTQEKRQLPASWTFKCKVSKDFNEQIKAKPVYYQDSDHEARTT